MVNRYLILALILMISVSFIPLISAENNDFVIGNIGIKTPAEYQDGYAVMKVRIDSLNSVCSQTCSWSATGGDAGSFTLNPEDFKTLEFKSNAIPKQGTFNGTLEVICSEPAWCGSADTSTKQFSHTYPFFGDYICTTTNNHEDCTITSDDCPCTTSGTVCIDSLGSGQWEGRNPDDRKCVTYCGNGIKESSYETCSSCPADIGQCDGYVGCVSSSECEGGFCVHNTCWNKPWREGDNFCDSSKEENCKNSADCSCNNEELCSNEGVCEKPETSEEEVSKAVQSGVQKTLESSHEKTKNVTLWAIGLIVLFIGVYLVYKFSNNKKTSSDKTEDKKKRIIELEQRIKVHKKHISKLEKKSGKTKKRNVSKKNK